MSNGYMPANRTNVHSEGVIFQLLLDTYQICCAGPARSCSSKVQGCALSMMFQLLLDTCSQLLHRQHQCFLLDMCLLRPCFEHLWNSCHLHLCHLSGGTKGQCQAAAEYEQAVAPADTIVHGSCHFLLVVTRTNVKSTSSVRAKATGPPASGTFRDI